MLGHNNRLVVEMSKPPTVRRRLKRQWPSDLPKPADEKIKTITIPLQGLSELSSVDDFSTQDTYLEQIYLLLHIIESRL
jgi:hypothetical protein